jgi:phospholipase/carboxylesterase
MTLATHHHLFIAADGTSAAVVPGQRTLLLLHGTGGDENSLLKLGRMLDGQANLLAVRGNVMEGPMPRFFRRLGEGVFDVPDMIARAHALADWLDAAQKQYAIETASLVAVGYSNGANIAAAMMYLRPGVFQHAILLRAMSVFRTREHAAPAADLSRTRVLLASGRRDPITPASDAMALAASLRERGASVEMSLDDGDHALTQEAVVAARTFVAASGAERSGA